MPSIARAPGVSLLGGRPEATALIAEGASVSYHELSRLIVERRAELGEERRLIMIAAGNEVEPIVTYLAALERGHPVLLVSGSDDEASRTHRRALVERFDPDVIAGVEAGRWTIDERRHGTRHELHPELALLASTSGSTGSPRLVRLSAENLRSNAAAIAQYLRLDPTDRAATTLPLQYCYGLSVVNSHLLAGASLLLTDRSVADEGFWREASAHRITSFAGVPYTFELLDAGGFAERELPSLRYLTQAGGRLAPDAVRRFARLGEQRGFELFVMYGQTEATARMAYLPPELAASEAGAIGRPIPGGRLRIEPIDDAADAGGGTRLALGAGELVYEGPNVMLGYAEHPADFALGRTVHELRTGDVARQRPDGLFEIVGRMNRFAKVFGLRLDLDRIEQLLADEGIVARAASTDERLLVFTTAERFTARARERAADLAGLPPHAVAGYSVAEFPRTSSGKPDTAALVRFATEYDRLQTDTASTATGGAGATSIETSGERVAPEQVRALLAALLGRPDAALDDSFAGLGGDSLSYIEVSLRLEELLGALPREWPQLTARELATFAAAPTPDRGDHGPTPGPAPAEAAAAHLDSAGGRGNGRLLPRRRRASAPGEPARSHRPRLVRLETPAVLRAAAIVLIVGTHADLFMLKGGAHLLLAVAGYNLARFQLAGAPGATRVRRLARSAMQLVVPAVLSIGAVSLVTGQYRPSTALLVNNLVPGDGRWNEQWQFWFLEAMVWTIVGLAVCFAVRAVDRLERRAPFGFALAVLGLALVARFAIAGPQAEHVERYAAPVVVWLIALGWLVARADTTRRRVLVSIVAVAASFGFFGEPGREAIVAGGVLALVWLPAVPLPRAIVPVVATLAGASMFVYLTHWQVYPPFEQSAPWLGTLLSLAVGVVAWRAYVAASAGASRIVRAVRKVPARGARAARPSGVVAQSTGAIAAVGG